MSRGRMLAAAAGTAMMTAAALVILGVALEAIDTRRRPTRAVPTVVESAAETARRAVEETIAEAIHYTRAAAGG